MFDPLVERWPPTYDAQELAEQIREMVESDQMESQFYGPVSRGPPFCQGDILSFENGQCHLRFSAG